VKADRTDYADLRYDKPVQRALDLFRQANLLLETKQPWKNVDVETVTKCAAWCAQAAEELRPICPSLEFPTGAILFPALPKELRQQNKP
jgi:methionyl-tRNA synthetase